MSWEEGDELRWSNGSDHGIFHYAHGTWWYSKVVRDEALRLEKEFVAYDDDIVLISSPKTGTTWLKSIMLCIKNRTDSSIIEHEEAHSLAPVMELRKGDLRGEDMVRRLSRPRFYQTHLPLRNLPESISSKRSRIVYITRNPKDTIVSAHKFHASFVKREDQQASLMEITRRFVEGTYAYGPFDKHVREYWDESRRGAKAHNPVCFLYYEELMRVRARFVKKR